MNNKILVFAGTYEGRKLCEYLNQKDVKLSACVPTDYAKDLLWKVKNIQIYSEQLNGAAIEDLLQQKGFNIVIDATHPYAKEVAQNIQSACNKAKTEYIRLLRDEYQSSDIDTVHDIMSAVEYLKNTVGNVLITTGSKKLSMYCSILDYRNRLFVRVLPSPEILEQCNQLGFKGRHLIGMQGPFSHDLNVAMLKQLNCSYLVTKNTKKVGDFDEKLSAAQETGTKILLIDRSPKEIGYSLNEVIDLIEKRYGFDERKVNVTLKKEYFPLFVSSKGKSALVVGGGKIATRRILTLLKFKYEITVVSPTITKEIEVLTRNNEIAYIEREFAEKDIEGYSLVVAATNDRRVNQLVGRLAKKFGIYVSVADVKEECTFYFPAVITQTDMVIGITSEGKSHKLVKEAKKKIEGVLP